MDAERTDRKMVAVFDIDKTLLPGYSIIDFAQFLVEQGLFKRESWEQIQEGMKRYKAKEVNYNQFADLVVEKYAQGLAGQEVMAIEAFSHVFWEVRLATLYPYVTELFARLREVGAYTIAISGSSYESLLPLFQHLNFSQIFSTQVLKDGGRYTDQVELNVASEDQKTKVVETILSLLGEEVDSMGFGDSIADAAFLRHVGLAVVIGTHDAELLALSQEHGWTHVPDPLREDLDLSLQLKM